MINNVTIVGRVVSDEDKVYEFEDGQKILILTLAVRRPFKNQEGAYDTDYISIKLRNNLCTIVPQYSKKGDILGVIGRLQIRKNEINGKNYQIPEIIGERVVFISPVKQQIEVNKESEATEKSEDKPTKKGKNAKTLD